MGRDFSLHQVDCALSLLRLHIRIARLGPATVQLRKILQTDVRDRIMLNNFKLVECAMPVFALELFGYNSMYLAQSADNMNDPMHAKYMLMLVSAAYFAVIWNCH